MSMLNDNAVEQKVEPDIPFVTLCAVATLLGTNRAKPFGHGNAGQLGVEAVDKV